MVKISTQATQPQQTIDTAYAPHRKLKITPKSAGRTIVIYHLITVVQKSKT